MSKKVLDKAYRAIAAHQGTTKTTSGRATSRQIVQKAASGQWIQDPSGSWYQKQ
jgi:uncharacterized protein YdbL (DUF1318 family)